MHRHWAGLGDRTGPTAAARGKGSARPADIRNLVRSRLSSTVADAARAAGEPDRALIGDIIRALDVLAARLDDTTDRLMALELLVREVVDIASEELTRLRAGTVSNAEPRPGRP